MVNRSQSIEISREIIENLSNKDFPEKVLSKLNLLENKIFKSSTEFESSLELLLGNDFKNYSEIILDSIEIIEDDNDTINQDKYESKGIYPYDPTKADINIQPEPQTVHELVIRKWKERGILKLDPDFQREFVWKAEQKSMFIESVLLGFPLPPFYLNKDTEGKYIVVDGRQRLTTLRDFLDNKFPLSDLNALPKLNGKYFNQLIKMDPDYQTKIEDRTLFVYLIPPSVPLEIVYDIFNRINTGGTQLQRQEVRNCIYIGSATKFLKELASMDIFKKSIDFGISTKRAKDQEAVLRYLSFQIQDYNTEYKGSMNDFVERAMQLINKALSFQKLEELKVNFERSMHNTFDFFNVKNFRIPSDKTRGKVNIAHFEAVSFYFSKQEDEFLTKNKEIIKNNYLQLIEDDSYLNAVTSSTGDTQRVKDRFNKALEILSIGTI